MAVTGELSIPYHEQQAIQKALTILTSMSTGMLSAKLLSTEHMDEKTYGDLARLIFRMTQNIRSEVDLHQSIADLRIFIGGKTTGQKIIPLDMMFDALSSSARPKKFPSADVTQLIAPSIIPGLFVLQERRAAVGGGVTEKHHNYYLVGQNNVPAEYQYSFQRA